MKRGLLLLALLGSVCAAARPVRGTVACGTEPLDGVLVTDGYGFARTDARGRFELDANDEALFIAVVTPSGYVAPSDAGIPQFFLPCTPERKRYDFLLKRWSESTGRYELLAIADPQPKTEAHFERLRTEIIPPLRAATADGAQRGMPQAALILGDIVWDAPELMDPVKRQFASLEIPVYPVIGNHDHDQTKSTDREATANYRRHFGPTYYAFDLGRTHYIVLDDIVYRSRRDYDEQIDSVQIAWAVDYAKRLPAGSRVCIAMHAPLVKSWLGFREMASAAPLLEALEGHEVHFITGHTHLNSNYDIRDNVVEHNVAQVCGNLWWDPLNWDGTPKGYQHFSENGDRFEWSYRTLDAPEGRQLRLWRPGQVAACPDKVVAKAWNWDPHWTVVWYEDGRYRGAMQRIELDDPDYAAHLDSLKAAGRKLSKVQRSRNTNFYFAARPSAGAREVRVEATDRFGNRYSDCVRLR